VSNSRIRLRERKKEDWVVVVAEGIFNGSHEGQFSFQAKPFIDPHSCRMHVEKVPYIAILLLPLPLLIMLMLILMREKSESVFAG
jgi:hypothetical protein